MSVKVLAGIATKGKSESARVQAADLLLNRGWGKAAQPVTGAEGGAIEIILRNIAAEKAKKG